MQTRRVRSDWSVAEKLKIVEEARQPGATMSAVARRHGISGEELYERRRAAREGRLRQGVEDAPTFIPVVIEDAPAPAPSPSAIGAEDALVMTVSLPAGETLKFDARVEPALLGRVLQVLRR